MRRYRQSKVDGNQPDIVQAYRRAGATVCDLSPMGSGVPDLLIGHVWQGMRRSFVAEVKDPAQPACKRKLNPGETLWRDEWRGEYWLIETVDDVLRSLAGPADPEAPALARAAVQRMHVVHRAARERRPGALQLDLFDAAEVLADEGFSPSERYHNDVEVISK